MGRSTYDFARLEWRQVLRQAKKEPDPAAFILRDLLIWLWAVGEEPLYEELYAVESVLGMTLPLEGRNA